MKKSVTQEFEYGCGIACFAFALDLTYKQAESLLGPKQAVSTRFWVKDLAKALNNAGLSYQARHVSPKVRPKIYSDGTIVLIRRSKHYPSGHYLIRYDGQWMDPWINLPLNKNIRQARSGFRKRLPGQPMYIISKQTR